MHEYQSYKEALVRCVSQTVGVEVAEDIVQDAFLNLLQRDDIEQPRAWLFSWVRGHAIQYRRNCARHAALVDPDVLGEELIDSTLAPDISKSETTEQLATAIDLLSDEAKEMIRLAYWEGLSRAAIGTRFGIDEECAKKRTQRATKKLRKILRASHFACPA